MEELSKNIVEFYERLSSWEQAVVKDSGLTLPQMHTIEIIGNNGALRMKELAQKLGVVMGTLTVMINRLTEMGLVFREVSENDRRSYSVSLTKKGKNIHSEHHQHHTMLAQEIALLLSEDEQKQLNTTIEKILKTL